MSSLLMQTNVTSLNLIWKHNQLKIVNIYYQEFITLIHSALINNVSIVLSPSVVASHNQIVCMGTDAHKRKCSQLANETT